MKYMYRDGLEGGHVLLGNIQVEISRSLWSDFWPINVRTFNERNSVYCSIIILFIWSPNLTSFLSHEHQFSLGKILFVHTFHMQPSFILSLAYFVAQRARVATANWVFSFNVALHSAERSRGIAANEADEAIWRLHHQAFVDQFFCNIKITIWKKSRYM